MASLCSLKCQKLRPEPGYRIVQRIRFAAAILVVREVESQCRRPHLINSYMVYLLGVMFTLNTSNLNIACCLPLLLDFPIDAFSRNVIVLQLDQSSLVRGQLMA